MSAQGHCIAQHPVQVMNVQQLLIALKMLHVSTLSMALSVSVHPVSLVMEGRVETTVLVGWYIASASMTIIENANYYEDIDECRVGFDNCLDGPGAMCNNLVGSFECQCEDGFQGDGVNSCVGEPVANSMRDTCIRLPIYERYYK